MIKQILFEQLNVDLPAEDFYVTCRGRLITNDEIFIPGQKYLLVPRLVGGKGGFGSMLRAIGAQIEKTTNREACRDLRGRRMRDVNNEKKLREWGEKIGEREREKTERRRLKRERIKNRGTMHKFEDKKYDEQKELVKHNMEDAFQHALSKGKKAGDKGKLKKREITLVFGQENSDLSSDSEMEEQKKKIRKIDNSCKTSEMECTVTEGPASFDMITTSTHNQFTSSITSPTQDMNTQDPVGGESTSLTLEIKDISLISPESIDDTSTNTQNMNTIGSTQDMNTQIGDTIEMRSIENGVISLTKPNDLIESDIKSQSDASNVNTSMDKELIDLSSYEDAVSLEVLGLNELKCQLMLRGVKCGGTLTERAARLYSIKELDINQIPANLLAKGNKK